MQAERSIWNAVRKEPDLLGIWSENPLVKDCGNCRFLQALFVGSPFLICGYALLRGQSRGCLPGKACKRRDEGHSTDDRMAEMP